ncbi:MAG: ABC transporter permease [Ignavibacteriaceae bacterium]|nr:ABC transporter permease [Ignavibacteriaceae bacterium]
MQIPFKYVIRNFRQRKLTTIITTIGVGLVIFVFAAVLMMAYGIEKTLVGTGADDNVMIVRKSATSEISSIIEGDVQNIIRTLPFIAKDSQGKQLVSAEPVVVINLDRKEGGVSNITLRGVSEPVFQLRPQVKLIDGRMFRFGVRELIVGESIAKRFIGAEVGSKIKIQGDQWTVVGKFSSNGSGFDSEIWGDGLQLLNAFNRETSVSSMTFKLDNVQNYDSFKKLFEAERRLQQFEPYIETKFFEKQSEFLALFIRILGIFITVIFSFGATIGAMITMYAAVANRVVEIGTMRALGFKRRSVLAAFLIESILISLIGGVIGVLLSSLLQFFKISTLNFASFSELEFSFALSPSIIVSSIVFALLMGIIGGFLPSVRASRLNIVTALKGS